MSKQVLNRIMIYIHANLLFFFLSLTVIPQVCKQSELQKENILWFQVIYPVQNRGELANESLTD